MCYHISFQVKLKSILDYFPDLVVDNQLDIEFPSAAYINGFNHQLQQVMLTGRKDGKRHLALMMWGFVPNHIKNLAEAERFWTGYTDDSGKWQTGYVTLNAMGEELFERKMYKDSALNRRCIIFSDGFYEWTHIHPVGKRGKVLKTTVTYPHHIFLKDSEVPFIMMAGIWNPWRHEEIDKETGELKVFVTPTFSIVTTVANELMAKIHNTKKRMPTILTKELAEEWIKDGLSQERITEIATYQYPSEKMDAYSIPKDFQKIDSPKERQHYPELDAVFC